MRSVSSDQQSIATSLFLDHCKGQTIHSIAGFPFQLACLQLFMSRFKTFTPPVKNNLLQLSKFHFFEKLNFNGNTSHYKDPLNLNPSQVGYARLCNSMQPQTVQAGNDIMHCIASPGSTFTQVTRPNNTLYCTVRYPTPRHGV